MSSAPANVISGFSITKDNFTRVCANFAARKSITNNWINNKDEFLAPVIDEINGKIWDEFVADSIVYSMFNSSSCQSSLMNAQWKGYNYRINNEFFFMSKKEMMEIGSEYDNTETIKSTFNDNERYAYELLKGSIGDGMSNEAIAVLNFARNLVIKTFKYRNEFSGKYPEMQINNWDCGYYQLKQMWKMYADKDLKEFRKLYKALANKLRKQVYELKILK
jgi:hypothetical protein